MGARLSREEAHRRLIGPGLPFEIDEVTVGGVTVRNWKNALPSLRAVFANTSAFGDAEFMVYGEERTTYAEHYRAVCRLAHVLRAQFGVRKGDRVALAMRNVPEWSVAFWAAASLGAIVVPLNAWFVGRELESCLVDSGSKVALLDSARAGRLAPHLDRLALEGAIVARSEGAALPGAALRWEDALAAAPGDAPLPDVAIEPEDDATIFYTSGTTGVPKGAVGTNRNICTNIASVACRGAVKQLCRGVTPPALGGSLPQAVTLVPVPFFHVTGCHSLLAPGVWGGSKHVVMHRWDPEDALALIERERVTSIVSVPGMILQLLESPRFAAYDTSSLVNIGYGGTPAMSKLGKRLQTLLPHVEAENGYGLTEASSLVAYNGGEDYRRKSWSCGRPVPTCEIKIMREDGTPAPAGALGELCVKGPNVVRGYWNRPDESARVFRDGWLHTGDLARIDENGLLDVLDRAKDMLIRGGENIYTVEVENVLVAHPAVLEAAVIGKHHPLLGQEVAAVVRAVPGKTVTAEALTEHCRARLAAFKVPVEIVIRREPLPTNAAGKILKRRLQDELFPELPGDTVTAEAAS